MTQANFLEIPNQFLSSAVVIDDALYWENEEQLSPASDLELITPDHDEFSLTTDTAIETAAAPTVTKVHAPSVIDGFADLGLVCSTYRWETGAHDTMPKSTKKADLIIIDWRLDDTATTALTLLEKRLQDDLNEQKRLRYIAIYTDQNADAVLDAIVDKFNSTVSGTTSSKNGDTVDVAIDGSVSIWRIKHIRKGNTKEADLANAILKDFAEYQDGILPRTVMAAVAEVKNHAFEHLYQFHQGLDASLTSHLLRKRVSELEFPNAHESFSTYTTNLVLEDVAAAMHSSKLVSSATDEDTIRRSLSASKISHFNLKSNPEKTKTLDVEQIGQTFFDGSFEDFCKCAAANFDLTTLKHQEKFNAGRNPIEISAVDENALLTISNLDQMNRYPQRDNNRYRLTSGTIVSSADDEGTKYFLCLQPVCDSVRLTTSTAFPLLKLSHVVGNGKFHFVVNDAQDPKKLKSSFKLSDVVSVEFEPCNSTNDIRSCGTEPTQKFTAKDDKQYTWVSELKSHYAAEAQSALAAQGGRVGTNKFEWLRDKSTD